MLFYPSLCVYVGFSDGQGHGRETGVLLFFFDEGLGCVASPAAPCWAGFGCSMEGFWAGTEVPAQRLAGSQRNESKLAVP